MKPRVFLRADPLSRERWARIHADFQVADHLIGEIILMSKGDAFVAAKLTVSMALG